MQGFNKEGHDVLNPYHSYHMEKVTKEKYAYIMDLTSAEFFVAEHCDFAIAPEPVFFTQYSLALQLHSAYTEDVNML